MSGDAAGTTDQPTTDQPTTDQPTTVPLDVGGQQFTLHVYADPSGLRGQVFDGQEKLAGVQVFHTTDVRLLIGLAQRDRAVLRAVERRTQPPVPAR